MHPFDSVTQYIPQLEQGDSFARIVREGSIAGVTVLPSVEYTPLAKSIVSAIYEITDNNEKYSMVNLLAIYDSSPFSETPITQVDVSTLDTASILALLAAILHMERWDSGTLYSFYYSGKLLDCLKRLKECSRQ